jgi:hypothetical protein
LGSGSSKHAFALQSEIRNSQSEFSGQLIANSWQLREQGAAATASGPGGAGVAVVASEDRLILDGLSIQIPDLQRSSLGT